MASLDEILRRAIDRSRVREVGGLTSPRSFGVYRLPAGVGATRRVRYGNHPVRLHELEREFGRRCDLLHLFLARGDAQAVAAILNGNIV